MFFSSVGKMIACKTEMEIACKAEVEVSWKFGLVNVYEMILILGG